MSQRRAAYKGVLDRTGRWCEALEVHQCELCERHRLLFAVDVGQVRLELCQACARNFRELLEAAHRGRRWANAT